MPVLTRPATDAQLRHEVETFLYDEAALLDGARFDEWLDLLHDDFRLFMPISRDLHGRDADAAQTREGHEMAWFDEGKETIAKRIRQLATGMHWAEEPRSRTVHMITNTRVIGVDGARVTAHSTFQLYRNRGRDETDFLIGHRTDQLLRGDGGFRLIHRRVDLAQTVLLSKNLTSFL